MSKVTCCLAVAVLSLSLLLNSGCAVYMAAHQPPKKNMGVLAVGMPRDTAIAEFGAPVHTEVQDGKKVDIFKFTQGYSGGTKAVRAVGHGVADVLTLGLWEVVGTPAEAVLDGKEIAIKVIYDEKNTIEQVIYLKEK